MDNEKIPGKVYVSPKAAAQLAAHIILRCSGVVTLCHNTGKYGIAQLSHRSGVRGVYIESTKHGIELDIYVICSHGTNTSALCAKASERITSEFYKAGITIKRINIHVAGINRRKPSE